jgi:outer membrane protein TolC
MRSPRPHGKRWSRRCRTASSRASRGSSPCRIRRSPSTTAWPRFCRFADNHFPTAEGRDPHGDRRDHHWLYSGCYAKKFRNGISIIPSATVVDYKADPGGEFEASSEVALEIVVPLLRGLGAASSATERAARSGLDAVQQLSRQQIARQVYQTAKAFWTNLTAIKSQAVFEDTEKRALNMLQLIKDMIAVGEVEPPALHEANARFNRTRTDTRQASLALYESRVSLAVAMGLGPKELAGAPVAQGEFPAIEQVDMGDGKLQERYISQALNQRGDYQAARINIGTEDILLGKARDNSRPKLDLTVRTGYRGVDASQGGNRYVDVLYTETAGPNIYAGLSGELPLFNDAALGEAAYRRALVREARLNAERLSNSIAGEVLVAIERLAAAITRYRLALQTERDYREAAEHSFFKLQEGESSLTGYISMEEDYQDARVVRLQAHGEYAIALAELHLAIGTLVQEGEGDARVNVNRLQSIPFPNG